MACAFCTPRLFSLNRFPAFELYSSLHSLFSWYNTFIYFVYNLRNSGYVVIGIGCCVLYQFNRFFIVRFIKCYRLIRENFLDQIYWLHLQGLIKLSMWLCDFCPSLILWNFKGRCFESLWQKFTFATWRTINLHKLPLRRQSRAIWSYYIKVELLNPIKPFWSPFTRLSLETLKVDALRANDKSLHGKSDHIILYCIKVEFLNTIKPFWSPVTRLSFET